MESDGNLPKVVLYVFTVSPVRVEINYTLNAFSFFLI